MAAVTIGQGAELCLSLARTLKGVYRALKHGPTIFQQDVSSIVDLLHLVETIGSKHGASQDHAALTRVLQNLDSTSQRLFELLKKTSRAKVVFTVLAQKEEIKQNFRKLERSKTNLLIFISMENTSEKRSMGAPAPGPLRDLILVSTLFLF